MSSIDRQSKMQRQTTTARFSYEHHITVPENSFVVDAVSDGHPFYKEHSHSLMPERWIHLIPMILILCFLSLWIFSHPVDLVIKNGSNGVQENQMVQAMLDHPLLDFFLLKPVSTSLAPAPLNQIAASATSTQVRILGNVIVYMMFCINANLLSKVLVGALEEYLSLVVDFGSDTGLCANRQLKIYEVELLDWNGVTDREIKICKI